MKGKHSSFRCKQTNCPSMLLGSEHRKGQKSVPEKPNTDSRGPIKVAVPLQFSSSSSHLP